MGMDRNIFLILVFIILIFVPSEDPRVLAAPPNNKDSPSPGPSPSAKADAHNKTLDSNSNSSHSKPKNTTDGHKPNPAASQGPSSLNDSQNKASHGPEKGDVSKNVAGPPRGSDSNNSPKKKQEDGACKVPCTDEGNLTACLLDSGSASNKMVILVNNSGEVMLKVNISVSASATIIKPELLLHKHAQQKINILYAGEISKIVLSAGHGNCTLQLQQAPASAGAPTTALDFFRLPTNLTPVYGAYLFFLSVLIVGGTWACCKLGRRSRRDGSGVAYQELEMGLPESSSAIAVETADGWDQGWDDDWEEKAVSRMHEIQRAGNVSANGLTSRSGNKEGWDDDWDD